MCPAIKLNSLRHDVTSIKRYVDQSRRLFIVTSPNDNVARSTDLHQWIKPVGLKWFIYGKSVASVNIHIFNDFIYVYSPGQWKTTSWGQPFNVNRKPLSLCPFVAGLKKML